MWLVDVALGVFPQFFSDCLSSLSKTQRPRERRRIMEKTWEPEEKQEQHIKQFEKEGVKTKEVFQVFRLYYYSSLSLKKAPLPGLSRTLLSLTGRALATVLLWHHLCGCSPAVLSGNAGSGSQHLNLGFTAGSVFWPGKINFPASLFSSAHENQ